jgi:two-component system chemotaxis response regulator CheY
MGVPVSFVAGTGLDAIIEFRDCTVKPRVVLMDNRLPRMSGVEATRAILSMAPDTRVIFLSADSGARDGALAAGATLFLSKPARVSDITDAIKSAMAECPATGGPVRNGTNAPIGSA